MQDAEVLSGRIIEESKPKDTSELDRVKTKLAEVMAEERTAQGRHDRLVISQLELTAQVSESETRLDAIAAKKQALQTSAMELAKRNGKGKSK